MQLIGSGRVITLNDDSPFIEDGCVAVDGDEIVDFGGTSSIKAKYPHAPFRDVEGRIIMPGFINAHTHIYSSFARGLSLPQDKPNLTFGDILKNMWWRIDKALNEKDNLYSAYSTGLESVRCGVTTLFDHHASQRHISGSLSAIERALDDIGLRGCLCYEVSDRDGMEAAREGIEENVSFIDHAAKSADGRIKGMFGLHASFTLSERTLEKCVAAMGGKNAGFHIHCAEGEEDLNDSLARYGKRVLERLNDARILGEKTLAIHNVHANSTEVDILKSTRTMAVHNPESNMSNAVGCAPALYMIENGILLGLGTDAYTQDMLESLKAANLIHKHENRNPSIGFMESIQMLLKNNALICSRFWSKPVGIIKKGALADLIALEYTPHTPLNADTMYGHILFGLSGRCVDDVMINGKYIMKSRVMECIDEDAVLAKAREQSADFWHRV
ncbi:MAG: putative aminohydrolase SsnA [Clostridiales bacterium]|jgi:putative selenium metabolism protein SsnA|nr:putative aminohydrolase SsnA [Clostridiales bacterium]